MPGLSRDEIAEGLGISPRYVTNHLLQAMSIDPAIVDHVAACRHDEEMLAILVRLDRPQPEHGPLDSLADFWARFRAGKPVMATPEVYDHRLATCLACEHVRSTLGQHKCGLCGCVVEWKARLAGEVCPDGAAGSAGRW